MKKLYKTYASPLASKICDVICKLWMSNINTRQPCTYRTDQNGCIIDNDRHKVDTRLKISLSFNFFRNNICFNML